MQWVDIGTSFHSSKGTTLCKYFWT